MSLSLRERGLKCRETNHCKPSNRSLSLRERGLKSQQAVRDKEKKWSLSLRERGLKLHCRGYVAPARIVALLARAWIEI